MIRTITVLAVLFAAPLSAQEGPSFDCSKASTSAEEMVCAEEALARIDRLLAERYAAALKVTRGLDAGAAEAEAELKARQRGWIAGRDDCWKAEDPSACILFSYQRREGELVARWMLEEPTGTATWRCADNSEIVSYFYDTSLPSVRIERGDSVTTASLSPSGSGSRYDGDFGEFLWIKGDEATYRSADPDGAETTCRVDG